MCRNFVLCNNYTRGIIISPVSTFYNNVVKMGICSRTPRIFRVVNMPVQKWFNRYVYKMVQYSDFSNYMKKNMLNRVARRIRGVVVWLKYVSPFPNESAKFLIIDGNFSGSRNKLAYQCRTIFVQIRNIWYVFEWPIGKFSVEPLFLDLWESAYKWSTFDL